MLLVVGSIAIDGVQTPKGEVGEALGGSASYFSYAASFFTPVRVVGVVGEDFPDDYLSVFLERENIDIAGITRQPGKSFRWKGRYSRDMNSRETLEVHLNVFGEFDPDVPGPYRDSAYVFLANASPVVQRKVLHQIRAPKLVVADTMDLWIKTQRDELLELMQQIDGLILNDQEIMLLTEAETVVKAGTAALEMGPEFVIVKKGEHGAMFFNSAGVFSMPAFPTALLVDPTGAGDSFAGGLMGYLTQSDSLRIDDLKKGMAYGTVVAAITVEDFSLRSLRRSSVDEIQSRFNVYRDMLRF